MKIEKADMGTTTDPVLIKEEEPNRFSIMIQTLPPVEEKYFEDPLPLNQPEEPIRFTCDSDDDN